MNPRTFRVDKTVIMLMGKSGCGKSTLERGLVTGWPELFHKVVSVTTRKPREGEVEGKDYRFIDERTFREYEQHGELIQQTSFAGNHYGSLYSEYMTTHPYAILCVVPESAARFIPVLKEKISDINIFLVYFDISDERLRENMLRRGDNPKEIEERLAKDDLDVQFRESGLEADLIIGDNLLRPHLPKAFAEMLVTIHQPGPYAEPIEALFK